MDEIKNKKNNAPKVCNNCFDYNTDEIQKCPETNCSAHPYRFGIDPFKAVKAQKRRIKKQKVAENVAQVQT